MLRHALFSAVVAAATALVVPTAQQVSHSLSIPVSAGYGSAIAAQGEVQSSFQAATLASIQDAFSLDDVTITGVDFASSQRRRAQGGDSKVSIPPCNLRAQHPSVMPLTIASSKSGGSAVYASNAIRVLTSVHARWSGAGDDQLRCYVRIGRLSL